MSELSITYKVVVLDIEGTTTPIVFVRDVLFPYVTNNLESFLEENWGSKELNEKIDALRQQSIIDHENKTEGVIVIPDSSSVSKEELQKKICENVRWQMSYDRKIGALKSLQGYMWRFAYETGMVKGEVYDDVVPAFDKWLEDCNQKIYIYSSGSIEAQKLIFGYSDKGDLLSYFSGHFDTGIGLKMEKSSYEKIAKEIKMEPKDILFVSDNVLEIKAAQAAGFQVAVAKRPGNAELSNYNESTQTVVIDGHKVKVVTSFAQFFTKPATKSEQPPQVQNNGKYVHPSPYRSNYADLLSRTSNFSIIESTLREGEQFANAFFDTETKLKIAKMLDEFGVEYIEVTSPVASEQSRADCEAICKLGLKAKILTHTRCHMDDARVAVETGVDGLDIVIGTSSFLREFSHGKNMEYITKQATEVITFIKSKGLEVRFSSEDSFRSDLVDLLNLYKHVDKLGVNRVGIADTVGCANPRQVYELVRTLRSVVSCDIECHFHNDTGCAIANAYAALEAGATHIDTSVLGIGERNGITPLGGLAARMYVADAEYVKGKYNLGMLREIENYVAEAVQIQVPFNNYITGYCAFTHKAGIHAKAILNNPATYEILKPEDFGMTRYVSIGHRLTGWNAVKNRVQQLGLKMSDEDVKAVTAQIKELADIRPLGLEEVDVLLRKYHDKLSE